MGKRVVICKAKNKKDAKSAKLAEEFINYMVNKAYPKTSDLYKDMMLYGEPRTLKALLDKGE